MTQHLKPLFEAANPAEMLSAMARRVDLIRQSANEAKPADFDRKWISVLAGCGRWFSSLPLSPDLYREPGGAFRATVETAFYAMRLAGGQKFGANLPSERRRKLEPQYVYALFLAAACSKLDEPYRYFNVVRDCDQAEWQPVLHGPLSAWLSGSPYLLQRRTAVLAVERMRTGMLTQIVVGPELLAELEPEVQSELFGAINPSTHPQGNESLLHKVVRQAVTVASDFDRKSQAATFAPVDGNVPPASEVAAQVPLATTTAAPPASSAPLPSPAPASGTSDQTAPAVGGTAAATPMSDAHLVQGSSGPPVAAITPFQATMEFDDRLAAIAAGRPGIDLAALEEMLRGTPDMIKDFFRALHEDASSGRAKLAWSEKGLVLPKRLIGGYGVPSETLIDHLKKRSLVVGNNASEVVLAPKAGEFILPRGAV